MNRYTDTYSKTFSDRNSFMDEVAEHRETQRNVKILASELRVLTSDDLDVVANVPDYLVEDTDAASGIYLKAGAEILPVRDFVMSQFDRMIDLKTESRKRLTLQEYSEMVNTYYLPKIKKEFCLFVEDEKISGILGAKSFSEIPAIDVLHETMQYINDEFPEASYAGGSFSHEYVEEVWRLDEYGHLFDDVLEGQILKPKFSISTSDCGASSVTIRPYLTGKVVMPATPLRVQHRGRNGLEDVKENLNKVYSLIEKGCSSLKRLAGIEVKYPDTCILRVMQACKIPKEAGHKVAAQFSDNRNPEELCTALDVYQAVCETLMYVPAGASMEQKFRYTDDVARVAGVNWKKYDLPGRFSW